MAEEAPVGSVDATIDSTNYGGTASSCNNNNVVVTEASGVTSDKERSLEYAEELMEKGSKANKEDDFELATDCFSRALEIRICLCLEIGSKGQEAIPYCQKAISVCKSRLQRLTGELESSSGSVASANPESGLLGRQSSSSSQTTDSVAEKEKEIEILTGLSSELEKKLEDLQLSVSNPSSLLSDILGMVAAKAKGGQTSDAAASGLTSSRIGTANSSGFESPSVSTANTNGDSGVTHLGVVGRGVKRVNMSSAATESTAAKKPASDPSAGNGASI